MKESLSLPTLGLLSQACPPSHSAFCFPSHTAGCSAFGSNPISPGWVWREKQLWLPELRGARLKGYTVRNFPRMRVHCGTVRDLQTEMGSHSGTLSFPNWEVSRLYENDRWWPSLFLTERMWWGQMTIVSIICPFVLKSIPCPSSALLCCESRGHGSWGLHFSAPVSAGFHLSSACGGHWREMVGQKKGKGQSFVSLLSPVASPGAVMFSLWLLPPK